MCGYREIQGLVLRTAVAWRWDEQIEGQFTAAESFSGFGRSRTAAGNFILIAQHPVVRWLHTEDHPCDTVATFFCSISVTLLRYTYIRIGKVRGYTLVWRCSIVEKWGQSIARMHYTPTGTPLLLSPRVNTDGVCCVTDYCWQRELQLNKEIEATRKLESRLYSMSAGVCAMDVLFGCHWCVLCGV